MADILKSLTRDHNQRPRDVRPGEKAETLWDELYGGKWKMAFGKSHKTKGVRGLEEPETHKLPNGWTYSDADALEDAILFPEELTNPDAKLSVPEAPSAMDKWESSGPKLKKFCLDLDSDEESDEDSNDNSDLSSTRDGADETDSDEDGEFVLEEECEDKSLVDETHLQKFHPNATPEEVWSEAPAGPLKRKSWDSGFAKLIMCLSDYLERPERTPEWLKRNQTFRWFQKWDKRNAQSELKRLKPSTRDEMMHAEFIDFIQRDKSHGKLMGPDNEQGLTDCSV
jgi:hypothetical protein